MLPHRNVRIDGRLDASAIADGGETRAAGPRGSAARSRHQLQTTSNRVGRPWCPRAVTALGILQSCSTLVRLTIQQRTAEFAQTTLWGGLVVLAVIAATTLVTGQRTTPVFPLSLDAYLTRTVRLTAAERQRLAEGTPVMKLLDGDGSKEVTVFGAIWINATVARYLSLLDNIETFERGQGFRMTRRISSPPRLDDFSTMQLPEEDIESLKTCRIGHCEVKLDEQGIGRVRSEVNWSAPAAGTSANALIRELLLSYVRGYVTAGDARIPIYRDKTQPTLVGADLREMIAELPDITPFMPAVRRDLLADPPTTPAGSPSFLYWQETEFGLKPTIRISHLNVWNGRDATVVVSKMLYATHYFGAALELRGLFPDPARGPGFWFVSVNRSRLDGLSGFTGVFVRHRVRSGVLDGTRRMLQTTRQKVEAR